MNQLTIIPTNAALQSAVLERLEDYLDIHGASIDSLFCKPRPNPMSTRRPLYEISLKRSWQPATRAISSCVCALSRKNSFALLASLSSRSQVRIPNPRSTEQSAGTPHVSPTLDGISNSYSASNDPKNRRLSRQPRRRRSPVSSRHATPVRKAAVLSETDRFRLRGRRSAP